MSEPAEPKGKGMARPSFDEVSRRRERRRLRALVADDDAGLRRLLAAVLEQDGWEVQCASDGEEAIALAAEYEPDAVVLDLLMPNTNGLTALRRLRAERAGRDCAVVMVSALDEQSARREAHAAGCDDYLVKPFTPDELASRVNRAVERSRETSG